MPAPTPQTWTLRLKSHKTTVLLHIDPLQSFTSIKHLLYTALQETGFTDPDTGAQIPLPDAAEDIQLGRAVDTHDASLGFRAGEWESGESGDGKGKGKGKAKDGRVGMCVKGVGLKDGAVLAFRWVGDGMWDGEGGDHGQVDMWGVRVASFEDAYGVENAGDVGGRREFEG